MNTMKLTHHVVNLELGSNPNPIDKEVEYGGIVNYCKTVAALPAEHWSAEMELHGYRRSALRVLNQPTSVTGKQREDGKGTCEMKGLNYN